MAEGRELQRIGSDILAPESQQTVGRAVHVPIYTHLIAYWMKEKII